MLLEIRNFVFSMSHAYSINLDSLPNICFILWKRAVGYRPWLGWLLYVLCQAILVLILNIMLQLERFSWVLVTWGSCVCFISIISFNFHNNLIPSLTSFFRERWNREIKWYARSYNWEVGELEVSKISVTLICNNSYLTTVTNLCF